MSEWQGLQARLARIHQARQTAELPPKEPCDDESFAKHMRWAASMSWNPREPWKGLRIKHWVNMAEAHFGATPPGSKRSAKLFAQKQSLKWWLNKDQSMSVYTADVWNLLIWCPDQKMIKQVGKLFDWTSDSPCKAEALTQPPSTGHRQMAEMFLSPLSNSTTHQFLAATAHPQLSHACLLQARQARDHSPCQSDSLPHASQPRRRGGRGGRASRARQAGKAGQEDQTRTGKLFDLPQTAGLLSQPFYPQQTPRGFYPLPPPIGYFVPCHASHPHTPDGRCLHGPIDRTFAQFLDYG
eukprot:TRINITY_DN93447_c0_g1_i1.p1 TRINITY_DN93447_c0_g1~~TRINITY_DN93447_c0_g1_i1.p1  ORF type:complete len:297 (-),score=28.56 TRINITY_DN93447_c0_g1_i1:133-1023(-)